MRPIRLSVHDSDCVIRRTVVFAYTSTESKVQHIYTYIQETQRELVSEVDAPDLEADESEGLIKRITDEFLCFSCELAGVAKK